MSLRVVLLALALAACTRVTGPCTVTVEHKEVLACEPGGAATRMPVPQ